jgi:hypothetical protein
MLGALHSNFSGTLPSNLDTPSAGKLGTGSILDKENNSLHTNISTSGGLAETTLLLRARRRFHGEDPPQLILIK